MRSERHSDLEEAVHVRLSRKQLPRVTDDGYVEYGLRVPQDVGGLFPQQRQHGNPAAAATRSRRDPQVRFASTCRLHLIANCMNSTLVSSNLCALGRCWRGRGMDIEGRRRGEQGHPKLLRAKRAQRSISREVRIRNNFHPTNVVYRHHLLFPRFPLFLGAIGEE